MHLAFSSIFLTGISAFAAPCTYTLDPHSVQVGWTAFKTMQKLEVAGSFTELTLGGELKHLGSLQGLLSQLDAEIPLKTEASISTGNPARDLTLFHHFFEHFKNTTLITGSIHDSKGNDRQGEFQLRLKLNEKEVAVPMSFTRDKKGSFTAKGGMDVLDFGLTQALAHLHETCEVQHKGVDGISKTWPIVEIKLQANIEQKCAR